MLKNPVLFPYLTASKIDNFFFIDIKKTAANIKVLIYRKKSRKACVDNKRRKERNEKEDEG